MKSKKNDEIIKISDRVSIEFKGDKVFYHIKPGIYDMRTKEGSAILAPALIEIRKNSPKDSPFLSLSGNRK